jgi:hypothetical protein
MSTTTPTPTFTCASCEADAGPRPTFHLGLAFCCAGCAADGPCTCSYDLEPSDAPATPLAASATPRVDRILVVGAR